MKYRIEALGKQASPNGTVFSADGAAAAFTKFRATKKTFGAAKAYDENGAVSEAELEQRAKAEGWSG